MHIFWMIAIFAIGACVGSFLNVVIYRMPREESIVFPGSHCPACGCAIRWYDNIPLLSWLVLAGRCRKCKCRISPRYLLIELLTAVLLAGLYACYFPLGLRDGAGELALPFYFGGQEYGPAWPMFIAQATLVCGLLACSAVDIEQFIVLLPVMRLVVVVGIAAAAFRAHPFNPTVGPALALAAVGASVGLLIAKLLVHAGIFPESFIDASDHPVAAERKDSAKTTAGKTPARRTGETPATRTGGTPMPQGVAITSAYGVNPRLEVLKEFLFLLPAIILGVVAFHVAGVEPVSSWLNWLWKEAYGGAWGQHVSGASGALWGMLMGVAWIWGTRILGTLGFGKEAMGLGDVYILAGIGAVGGWKVATLTFFAAPIFGLGWALWLAIFKGKRELPYGPWLALAAVVVLLFFDLLDQWIFGFMQYM